MNKPITAKNTKKGANPERAPTTNQPQGGTRLQLLLAEAGIASRRHAAKMIRSGCVRVNGKVVLTPGFRVESGGSTVSVHGRELALQPEPKRTIMLHKPVGLVSSASSRQGRSVCELVAHLPQRLVPAGRLDRGSSGLLLLSNDGELIARLTHPRFGHAKLYEVVVEGNCSAAALERLRAPMELEGYQLRPVEVKLLHRRRGRAWLRFTLHEGRNRQIRKMCEIVGLKVLELKRLAVGGLHLGNLPLGAWRDLTAAEIAEVKGEEAR